MIGVLRVVVAGVIFLGGYCNAEKMDKKTAFLCGWGFAMMTSTLFRLLGWMS